MNLEHVQGVEDYDDHYVIDHRHQPKFMLPKDGLSQELHAELRALPGYAKGGEILPPDPTLAGGDTDAELARLQQQNVGASKPRPVTTGLIDADLAKGQAAADAAIDASPFAAVKRYNPATGPDVSDVPQQLADATVLAQQAIDQHAQAKRENQDAIAAELKLQGEHTQGAITDYEGARAAIDAQQKNLEQAVMNGHLDPNRIWGDPSQGGGGGNRILSTIGMALSAMGSGLAGGSNVAYNMVHDAIDRDVDAQKLDLLRNREMLEHYRQKGLDLSDVLKLRKANALDLAGIHIQQESAKLGSKEAITEGMALGAKLKSETAQGRLDMAGKMVNAYWAPKIQASQLAGLEHARRLQDLQAEEAKLGIQGKGLDLQKQAFELKQLKDNAARQAQFDATLQPAAPAAQAKPLDYFAADLAQPSVGSGARAPSPAPAALTAPSGDPAGLPAFMMQLGHDDPGRLLEAIPNGKDWRERMIRLPGGKVLYAKDKEQASEIQKALGTYDYLRKQNLEGRALMDANKGVGLWRGKDKARADFLHNSQLAQVNEFNNQVSKFSEMENKLVEKLVPDYSSFWESERGKAEDFQQNLDKIMWSHLQAVDTQGKEFHSGLLNELAK